MKCDIISMMLHIKIHFVVNLESHHQCWWRNWLSLRIPEKKFHDWYGQSVFLFDIIMWSGIKAQEYNRYNRPVIFNIAIWNSILSDFRKIYNVLSESFCKVTDNNKITAFLAWLIRICFRSHDGDSQGGIINYFYYA